MELIGLGDRDDLRTFNGRIAARDEIDARMADLCAARTLDEVLDAFEEAEAAAAPVYDMADVARRPALRGARRRSSRSTACRCRASSPACPRTPGEVRWAGRALGADDPARWDEPT